MGIRVKNEGGVMKGRMKVRMKEGGRKEGRKGGEPLSVVAKDLSANFSNAFLATTPDLSILSFSFSLFA